MAKPSQPDRALGDTIRELRKARGESIEGLGHTARLTANSLAKIELSKSDPAWSSVRAIATALGMSMQELSAAVEATEHGSV